MQCQVGLRNVTPLKQQGCFGHCRNRIGKAVPHVQARWMAALSKPRECDLCGMIMALAERDGRDVWQRDQLSNDGGSTRKAFSRQHHPGFEKGRPPHQDFFSADQGVEKLSLGLAKARTSVV